MMERITEPIPLLYDGQYAGNLSQVFRKEIAGLSQFRRRRSPHGFYNVPREHWLKRYKRSRGAGVRVPL